MKDIELPMPFGYMGKTQVFTAAQVQRIVEADRAQRVPEDSDLWCGYVAEMVGAYIKEPVGSEKVKAIAGVIRRRMPTRFFASTPAQPAHQEPSEAEMVCAEAYQVVGCLLSDLGLFETEAARKILDNLSEARMVHQDVLPWEAVAAHQEPPHQERKPMTDEIVRLAGVVLNEMPHPMTNWQSAAKKVCEAVAAIKEQT